MRRQPLSAMPKADGAAEVRRVKSREDGAALANALHPAMHDQTRHGHAPQHDYIKWNERREALRPTSSWGSNTWPFSATERGSGRCSNNSTSSHVRRHCLHGPRKRQETDGSKLCRRHRSSLATTSAMSPPAAVLLRHRRRAVCDELVDEALSPVAVDVVGGGAASASIEIGCAGEAGRGWRTGCTGAAAVEHASLRLSAWIARRIPRIGKEVKIQSHFEAVFL